MREVVFTGVFASLIGFAISAPADYLDLTNATTGTSGGFTGTLGGVSVNGALTSTANFVRISAAGSTTQDSTIDDTSPQFSYGSIFTPSQALSDRVGYVLQGSVAGTAQLNITFGQPVTNPVFHVANVDTMIYDFSPTVGLSGLSLLSGNGGSGDGIAIDGLKIIDANAATLVATSPTTPPPTTGGRSGYGSVQLTGTFSSLSINLPRNPSAPFGNGDGGSFTLSANIGAPPDAIDFYRLGKRIAYTQTSNSQSTTPVGFDGGVDLYANNAAALTSARVFSTSPTLLSPASPFVLSQYAPGSWISSQFYNSLESMDTYLPPGDTFGYLIEGGSLGNRLALLRIPETNLFAADVPYFTNNAFSQLNGLDPTDPFNIQWNGFTPEVGVTDAPIFFTIYRVSDGQSMIGTVVANSVTSFLIPANTLAPATQYRAELYYSSRVNTVDAGFIDADAGVTFDLVTNLDFTTGSSAGSSGPVVPEPAIATLALSGLIVIVAVSRVRQRTSCGCLVLIVSLSVYSSDAEAAIDFYRVGKTMVYQQTSASQPTTPSSIYGGVDLATPSPADLTSARVFSTTTTPPSPVPEFVLTQFFPGYWGSSRGYASLAEMDTNLPPGDTFGFLIEGGALGAQLALLPLPATDLFAPDVPYLTGSTFNQLDGMDPTAPLTVTWNSYTPLPGVTEEPIFLISTVFPMANRWSARLSTAQ